jgi:hypothetical protein
MDVFSVFLGVHRNISDGATSNHSGASLLGVCVTFFEYVSLNITFLYVRNRALDVSSQFDKHQCLKRLSQRAAWCGPRDASLYAMDGQWLQCSDASRDPKR